MFTEPECDSHATSEVLLMRENDRNKMMMKKRAKLGLTFSLLLSSSSVSAGCIGYVGPGGPCSMGLEGGLSTGPGNNRQSVPMEQDY